MPYDTLSIMSGAAVVLPDIGPALVYTGELKKGIDRVGRNNLLIFFG